MIPSDSSLDTRRGENVHLNKKSLPSNPALISADQLSPDLLQAVRFDEAISLMNLLFGGKKTPPNAFQTSPFFVVRRWAGLGLGPPLHNARLSELIKQKMNHRLCRCLCVNWDLCLWHFELAREDKKHVGQHQHSLEPSIKSKCFSITLHP